MDVQPFVKLAEEAAVLLRNNRPELAAKQYIDLLEATASQADDSNVKELRLKTFGELCLLLGSLSKFQDGLTWAEAYYREADALEHQSAALTRIASYAVRIGNYQRAHGASEENCLITNQAGHELLKAKAWTSRAHVFFSTGRLQEAVIYLNNALPLLEQLEDLDGQRAALNRLGLVYQQLGMMDKAIENQERYLLLVEQTAKDNLPMQIAALDNLGESYLLLFDMPKALESFKQGLGLAENLSMPNLLADLYRNQGEVLIYMGETKAALDSLYCAFRFGEQSGDLTIIVQILYSLAIAELQMGDAAVGYEHANQLLQLAMTGDLRSHRAKALYALGLYHRYQGDIETAEQCWQEAIFLAHETQQRGLLWQLHASLGEIATSMTLSRVHYRIAAEVIHQIAQPIGDEKLRQTFLGSPLIQLVLQEVV